MTDRVVRKVGPTTPLITYALVTSMLIVSLPTLVWPQLNRVFGGIGTLHYGWQILTSAFQHGWPGVPLLLHLAGNLALIMIIGAAAEKLLGAARFLALTLLAISLYGVTRKLTGLEANGASVFIWSYAPAVFLALRHRPAAGDRLWLTSERYSGVLFIMWIVVPLGMGLAAYAGGASWVWAVPLGNAFHISATVAGIVAMLLWKDHIVRPPPTASRTRSRADKIAAAGSLGLPAFLLLILMLVAVGAI